MHGVEVKAGVRFACNAFALLAGSHDPHGVPRHCAFGWIDVTRASRLLSPTRALQSLAAYSAFYIIDWVSSGSSPNCASVLIYHELCISHLAAAAQRWHVGFGLRELGCRQRPWLTCSMKRLAMLTAAQPWEDVSSRSGNAVAMNTSFGIDRHVRK